MKFLYLVSGGAGYGGPGGDRGGGFRYAVFLVSV